MALPLPSDPPPGKPRHRAYLTPLPGLRVKTPRREHGRRKAAELVDNTLKRIGGTDEELANALAVNPKLFEGWRDATEGCQLGDLLEIAMHGREREALAILDAAYEFIRGHRHRGSPRE